MPTETDHKETASEMCVVTTNKAKIPLNSDQEDSDIYENSDDESYIPDSNHEQSEDEIVAMPHTDVEIPASESEDTNSDIFPM